MHQRARYLIPLTLATLLVTSACGESGSSGGGGGSSSGGGSASGEACAPIPGEELVVLEDDKSLQNADNVIPAVTASVAAADPNLLEVLNTISAELTTDDLIELNAGVDLERKSAEEVAKAYVDDRGLTEGVSGGSGPIVVGGANFTESTILANVYAEVLNAAGYDASVAEVQAREVYLPALQSGAEIQVFPEYVATVADFINQQVNGPEAKTFATNDAQETLDLLTPLAEQVGLTFGEPSEAVDQNAWAVTQEFADELGVSTLSELAEACDDGSLILGGPTTCPERPQCQVGLEETYGLEFASFTTLDTGGPLTKAGILQGEVSMGLVFSSDGALARD